MSLTIDAATARIVRELHASEATICDALVAASALMHSTALADSQFAEVPALKSQSALLHLNKMLSGLIEARGEALRAHSQLLDIGREMGATESPYCPPRNSLEAEQLQAA
ncbi:MAG: hypothetical protein EDM03_08925 [Porphyrobacter sp. IPPAS B-1204]|nr:MAG: hypothetical protein EDM03_08925 [Porphyrobacter sp. IPPAS B-1204]